jgi:hypothetical protein
MPRNHPEIHPARAFAAVPSARIAEGRMVFDPPLASQVLATMNFFGQRGVFAPHVRRLAGEMERGMFRAGGQIAFVRHMGALTLVDGQHRLRAVVMSARAQEFQVLIVDAGPNDNVGSIYYTFDRGARARGDADVLNALGIPERFGLNATVSRAVFHAYPLLANHLRRVSAVSDTTGSRLDDVRLEGCEALWPLAARFSGLMAPAPAWLRKRLYSAQGMASALVTLTHQPDVAERFWSGLAADDGLMAGDPRKALLTDIAGRAWGHKSSDGLIVISAAWNAFFAGRPLAHIKRISAAQIWFAGTPYGRQ